MTDDDGSPQAVDETRASFEAAFSAFKELALADPARYYFAAWHFHEAKRHILALEAANAELRARVAECEAALELARAYLRLPTNVSRRELARALGEAHDEASAPGSFSAARGVFADADTDTGGG